MTEEELLEILLAFLPESFEGWAATVVSVSALLSFILPKPADDAHPVLRIGHKFICVMGLGATKLRAAGKIGAALCKGKPRQ